jgi:LmbE family N-acetylglucosaminyl deacetylase
MKRFFFILAALCSIALIPPLAQMRVVPLDEEQGHVALGLALRHLSNTGIFMNTTAHPDDENNGLLVMLNRGQGYRTALVTATRGNGGQNEIGPEIFEALGVLRTEELAALHRFDGAEQYFTRAVDFGYSFSLEETFEKWGRDEIVGDFVRLIRMVRPDVILGMAPEGAGGGQHHQASAILSREAFRAAGNPSKYPDQLKDGLRPWQPKKFYSPVGRGGGPGGASPNPPAKVVTADLAAYDSLLGKTYAEIGTEARSMHKSQGMAQLLSLPGPSASIFQLVESSIPGQTQRDERSLFDNIDRSIGGLAQFAGPRVPKELTELLSGIASAVEMAQKRFGSDGDEAALQPLVGGLRAVRAARGQLRGLSIDEMGRFEIDFRLRQKEKEFQQAILLANGVRVEALADDGAVVPGQPVRVSVIVANHGSADVAIRQVKFGGFDGDAACELTQLTGGGGAGGPGGRGGGAAGAAPGGRGRGGAAAQAPPISTLRKAQVARCDPTLRVRADERPSEPYWHRAGEAGRYTFDADAPFGLPYRPTPFYVQVTLGFASAAGDEVISGLPIQYRYEGNIFSGEKRSDVLVVPALSVRVSPEVAIVPTSAQPSPDARPGQTAPRPAPARPAAPAGRPSAAPAGRATAAPASAPASVGREIRVTVVNDTKGPVESSVKLATPPGWTSTPPEQSITFSREDESRTVRFQVRPPPTTKSGAYHIGAVATMAGQDFRRGYQVIEYPHVHRQHIYREADTSMKVLDVKTPPNLTVGYIMGVGDEVPAAIAQLGVKVEMIGADDLAWGDLTRFHTIVTGVRAYERRADLRANNSRLLEYVRNGGTVIVQYNKFEFNEAQYGPYPAIVSNGRVTDEHAPVTVVARGDPVFTMPNEITDTAWEGWVQERGLYFLGERDARYRDLVQLQDPFPYNAGDKRGALVETSYGKGRWVYVGLGLWRQLPAGVDGAYQLLANLISLQGS